MELAGRRIYLAGSAASGTPPDMLAYGHTLIDQLVRALAKKGATLAVGVGKEPHWGDDPAAPALLFDWTAIAAAAASRAAQFQAAPLSGRLLATVATSKTDGQIPLERRPLWDALLAADDVEVAYAPEGWYSAAYRRRVLAERCDAVILLSGGEGVEHLAHEFATQGKPVIPLDLHLGASLGDGSGGATMLAGRMRASPEQFVRLRDPAAAGALLTRMGTRGGAAPVGEVVRAILDLCDALTPPTAFFVRLLNPTVEHYAEVDSFFADVVTPTVTAAGFEPRVMGASDNDEAWMNQQIFEWLAESRLVVVDYTGVRPSCFIELGYALRGRTNLLVTARRGTDKVFDIDALEQYHWSEGLDDVQRRDEFVQYWRRNLRRPSIVTPRKVL